MKSVLITGASRGIGRELALAFGRAGYAVGVNCLNGLEKAEAVAAEIRRAGGAAQVFVADVRDSLKVRMMIDAAATEWGGLDVLINNAGITRDRTILKMTNGEWNDVIDTNLNGAFWCLREAARLMTKAKKGCILNIASLQGLKPSIGVANYAASKAGLIALTKAAARELGRFDVRVNAVLPGYHPTDMAADLPAESLTRLKADHALGRSTALADVTAMIQSIVENPSISGQVFNIDSRVIG